MDVIRKRRPQLIGLVWRNQNRLIKAVIEENLREKIFTIDLYSIYLFNLL